MTPDKYKVGNWMHEIKDDAVIYLVTNGDKCFLIGTPSDKLKLIKKLTAAEARGYGPEIIDELVEKGIAEIPDDTEVK